MPEATPPRMIGEGALGWPDGRGEVRGCVRSMFGRGAKGEANWCAGDGAGVGEGVGNGVCLRDSG